tara:strand:- start:27663 stop:28736 length:1074 start_codon:yes stop_codon:yes gene_type:complete
MKKTIIDKLVIDTSIASSKIYKSKNKDLKIGDIYSSDDIWDINLDFERLSTGIKLADNFNQMFNTTNIRRIEIEINGSGDSGSVDSVVLSEYCDVSEKYVQLHNYYAVGTMKLEEEYNNEGKYRWKMDSSNWADHNEERSFEKTMGEAYNMSPTEFFDAFTDGFKTYTDNSDILSGNRWIVKNINTSDKTVDMYRTCDKKQPYRNLPWHGSSLYRDNATNHALLLNYPSVPIVNWSGIEEHAYTQLNGSWEINEGSTNILVYTIIPDESSEDGFYVECDVELNQYVMETQTSTKTHVFKSDTSSKVRKFVKEELKISAYEGKTLDFSLKNDRSKIERLHQYITTINTSNNEAARGPE